MRQINVKEVTQASLDDLTSKANHGGYIDVGVTLLDPAGEVAKDGFLIPNGCIVVENYYCTTIIYMLPSGELVELIGD